MSLSGAVCRSVQSDLSPYIGIVTGVEYGRFHHAELVGLLMAQSCQSGWVSEIEHGRFWPGLLGHAADKE